MLRLTGLPPRIHAELRVSSVADGLGTAMYQETALRMGDPQFAPKVGVAACVLSRAISPLGVIGCFSHSVRVRLEKTDPEAAVTS